MWPGAGVVNVPSSAAAVGVPRAPSTTLMWQPFGPGSPPQPSPTRPSRSLVAHSRRPRQLLVDDDHRTRSLAAAQPLERRLDVVEPDQVRDDVAEVEPAVEHELDELAERGVDVGRAVVAPGDRLLATGTRSPAGGTSTPLGRQPDDRRRPAGPQHVPGLPDRGRVADDLEGVLDAAAGDRQHLLDHAAARRQHRVRGAPAKRELELALVGVDGDDRPGAGELRARDHLEPDAAAADHAHARADAQAGPVDRSDPGDDAAAEQRGLPQRDRRRQRHRARRRHDRELARSTRPSGRAGARSRRARAAARCRPSASRRRRGGPPSRTASGARPGRPGRRRTTGRSRTRRGRRRRRRPRPRRPPRRRPRPRGRAPSATVRRRAARRQGARRSDTRPAAATRTSTSPRRGGASTTVSTDTGRPGSRSTAARIWTGSDDDIASSGSLTDASPRRSAVSVDMDHRQRLRGGRARPGCGAAPRAGCDSGSRGRARRSSSSGSVVSQISPILRGQRVWNTQPLGGLAALGISPSRRMRWRSTASMLGHRRQQRLGVGVVREREDLVGRSELHQSTQVQHRDAIRQVAHHREVVTDEQVGDVLSGLEVVQQVQDRGLHRHVERRGGLVADDDPGIAGERSSDRDALLQPPRQLAGPHRQVAIGQPHRLDQRLAAGSEGPAPV